MVLCFLLRRTLIMNWCMVHLAILCDWPKSTLPRLLEVRGVGPVRVHSCAREASLGMLLLERRRTTLGLVRENPHPTK